MYKKIALALCATVFVAQACDIECNRSEQRTPGGCIVNLGGGIPKSVEDYYNFRCRLMETCKHYVAVINSLPTTEKSPFLMTRRYFDTMDSSNDFFITELRKVAVEFEDLRLRHDLMTRFSFPGSEQNASNKLLQETFKAVAEKLQGIAKREADIVIYGLKVLSRHSPSEIVAELVKSFEKIAALHGQFEPALIEVLERFLKPYVATCMQLNEMNRDEPADMQTPSYTEEPIIVEETNSNQPSVDVMLE